MLSSAFPVARAGPHEKRTDVKVDYIEESPVRKALAFEVEAEVVEKEIEAKARQYAKSVRLPGFRPGKVPPDVVKKRFRGAVLEDVVEALVNRVVREELDGRGLRPVDTPKVEDLKVGENEPLRFKAVFEVLPLVELPEWRNMPVKARRVEVPDEAVDKEIDRLREDAARYDPASCSTSRTRATRASPRRTKTCWWRSDQGTTTRTSTRPSTGWSPGRPGRSRWPTRRASSRARRWTTRSP
jgi:hypothetical protein